MPAKSGVGFPYEPLETSPDTIRLLVLHPKRKEEIDSVVRCSLIHSDFLSKPRYEALSYTWGRPGPAKYIFLNDFKFAVRKNLYSALCSLRYTNNRVLWADAICIDQKDDEERRYQIRLMPFIYHRAHCVLVWLGLARSPEEQYIFRNRSYNSIESHIILWTNLLDHEYWSRLWVVQEIGVSQSLKVCLGIACREWDEFVDNAGGMETAIQLARNGSYLFNLDAKRRGRHGNTNRLETLVEDFQYTRCEDPKDTIYGFLGLAHDVNGGLEADYSKSLSDLHADVIRFFCRKRALIDGSTNEFDRTMRLMRFSQTVLRRLQEIGANITNSSVANDVLQVRGAIGGHIIHLGPTYTDMLSNYDANMKWKLSFGNHYSLPQDIQLVREANESYGAILLQMAPDDLKRVHGIMPGDMYFKARMVKELWNHDENSWSSLERDTELGRDMGNLPISDNSSITSSQPRMFLANNRLLGLAPQSAREGDLICQFWKCDVALVLRLEETTRFYRIVGRIHLCTGYLKSNLTPVYDPWKDLVEKAGVLHIQMDINALRLLSC